MRFLVVDDMHSSLPALAEKVGIVIDYRPKITREEILNRISEYEGLLIRSKTIVDKELLEKAGRLKVIVRAGAGLEQIDLVDAEKKGIILIHGGEANRDTVAEHTVGLLLSLLHKITAADAEIRTYVWDREGNRGTELMGKTVAVIGYGNTGKAFAKRISSFGCRVLTYDKYLKNYSDIYASESSYDAIGKEADIVSFHIPMNTENKHLINEMYLEKFEKSIFLLNTSRGGILKTEALTEALKSGKIRGAGLDVLENENLTGLTESQKKAFEYLIHCKRVVLTPHTAGWSYESYERMNNVIFEKIESVLAQIKEGTQKNQTLC